MRMVGPSTINESITEVTFPQTGLRFSPFGSRNSNDFLVTCGDTVKLWQTSLNKMELTSEVIVNTTADPLTSLDWSQLEESLVICGSSDATASAIDLNAGTLASRILAHDHPIHDISFCGPSPSFVTAGFDGSIRFFDLRDLQSSIIYYQTTLPLLRVVVSPFDSCKIATFSKDSGTVTIIDSRQPGIPCGLIHLNCRVTCIQWSKLNASRIYSTDISGNMTVAELSSTSIKPDMTEELYNTNGEAIQSFIVGQSVAALTIGNKIQVIRNLTNGISQIPSYSLSMLAD